MNSFSKTLHRVRLERGFTQEKLAQELNVSRQTISHWENGRAYPDIDTIKLISQILDHNFLMEAEEVAEAEAAEAPAVEAPAIEPPAEAPVRTGNIRKVIIAVLAAAVLIAASFAAGFMFSEGGDDTDVPKKEPLKVEGSVDEAYSYAWFNQTREPVAGQAYLEIVPQQNPVYASEDDFWTYYFDVNFSGDAAFTVDRILYQDFFRGFNNNGVHVFTKETFIEGFGTDTYMPGESFTWQGGFPVQRLDAVCIAVEGTDANGNKLVFTGTVELSTEKGSAAEAAQ